MEKSVPKSIKIIAFLIGFIFVVGLMFTFTLAVAGGLFVDPQYLQAWDKDHCKIFLMLSKKD